MLGNWKIIIISGLLIHPGISFVLSYHSSMMIRLFFLDRKPKDSTDLIDQIRKFLISFEQVLVIGNTLQTHPVCQAGKVHLNTLDVVDGMVKSEIFEKNINVIKRWIDWRRVVK